MDARKWDSTRWRDFVAVAFFSSSFFLLSFFSFSLSLSLKATNRHNKNNEDGKRLTLFLGAVLINMYIIVALPVVWNFVLLLLFLILFFKSYCVHLAKTHCSVYFTARASVFDRHSIPINAKKKKKDKNEEEIRNVWLLTTGQPREGHNRRVS